MKKIVHATQMFALIAMFPVIVILELNHTTPTSSEIDSPSNLIEKKTNGATSLPKNDEKKMAASAFRTSVESLFQEKTF